MNDDTEDGVDRNHFAECCGCGPDAMGIARDAYASVTGAASWAHCRPCLTTFFGHPDEPLVCAVCLDQVTYRVRNVYTRGP